MERVSTFTTAPQPVQRHRPGLDRFRLGFLVALAPGAVVASELALEAGLGLFGAASPWASRGAALLAAAAQVAGALLSARYPRSGRGLWTVGWVAAAGLLARPLADEPFALLVTAMAVLGLISAVWDWTRPSGTIRARPRNRRADGVAGAFLGGLLVATLVLATAPIAPWPLGAACASATAVAIFGWQPLGRAEGWRAYRWAGALVVLPSALGLALQSIPALALFLALASVTPLAAAAHRRRRRASTVETLDWADLLFGEPARSMVLTFLLVGFIGGWMLSLPASAGGGSAVDFIDGLFTSFSAVCVTGLIVVDTPHAFSGFGQGVILLLIQVGGLGIMTFSVAGLSLLGRRLRLSHERTAAELLGTEDRAALTHILRDVFRVTLWTEALGFAALTALFLQAGDPVHQALWRGLFTSISAFCNAGFALQTESLLPYQHDPLVLLVVSTLIIVGGLGPVVVLAVGRFARRQRVTPHVRLVLWTSAILVAGGFVFIAAVEWSQGLAHLGIGDRLANALFQSVTLRTAGFNSVDLTALTPATVTVMMVLMFIGGSPGSTAGGIKTTTVAIYVLVVRAALRGETHPVCGSFRISPTTVYKAASVGAMGIFAALATILLLQLTQVMPLDVLVFEALSALGTVGLSIGGTGMLDDVGKILVIGAMFAGRVGPLTLFFFLSRRESTERVDWPEREVPVG